MGGNIVFKHVEANDYLVGIKVFVDCYRGSQDAFYEDALVMGIYSKTTNTLVRKLPLQIQPGFDDTLSITKKECAEPVDFCMFIAYYAETFTFNPDEYNDPNGYYISWERCCRNSVILNVRDPDEIGITFYAEVPPFTVKNTLPEFTKLPLNLLCVNNYFQYNFKVKDADGDSIVTSLVTPLKGSTIPQDDNSSKGNSASFPVLRPKPYDEVIWNDGFSLSNIMEGKPALQIDARIGVATVTPNRQGDFVFAVKVEEYRNGVKLGEVIREVQYKVSKCAENNAPKLDAEIQDSVFEVYPGETLNLALLFEDADGDSVYISAASSLLSSDNIAEPLAQFQAINETKKSRASFTWTPACHHINSEQYTVELFAADNGCPLPTTSAIKFYVKVLEPPVYPKPADFCVKRISQDSLLLTWELEEYGAYFGGVIIERKDEEGEWERVDTVKKKSVRQRRVGALNNTTSEVCFRIKAINICGVEGVESDVFCSILHVDKAPLEPELLNVSVNEKEHVELTWTKNIDFDFNSYQINRAINGDVFDVLATVKNADETYFTDSFVNVDSNFYAYYILTIDDCDDNSTRSEIGKTILLSGEMLPYDNNLYWSDFDLWEPSLFRLEGISTPAAFIFNQDFDKDVFTYTHDVEQLKDGIWQYRVHAINQNGTFVSYSNTLNLVQDPVVWIPNAFSPNGDALNDTWDIRADFVGEYFLQVFNRWGQIVFETEDPTEKWDGKNAMEGTYLYKVSYRDLTGRINFKTGSIHIIN